LKGVTGTIGHQTKTRPSRNATVLTKEKLLGMVPFLCLTKGCPHATELAERTKVEEFRSLQREGGGEFHEYSMVCKEGLLASQNSARKEQSAHGTGCSRGDPGVVKSEKGGSFEFTVDGIFVHWQRPLRTTSTVIENSLLPVTGDPGL